MYTFKAAICDDEPEMLNKIYSDVSDEFTSRNIAAECEKISDPFELLDRLKNTKIDVVFLDIDMPNISGMDIAKIINDEKIDTAIVFVTCHDMLVYDTFKYRPFDFIRKSHFDCEIGGVIDRIVSHLQTRQVDIVMRKGAEIIRVVTNDIIYIESVGNYVNIYTANGCEKYRDTLSSIEQQAGDANLIRVHKGFIANLNHIERLTGDELIMTDGTHIPVGRMYEKSVKSKILESFRRQV